MRYFSSYDLDLTAFGHFGLKTHLHMWFFDHKYSYDDYNFIQSELGAEFSIKNDRSLHISFKDAEIYNHFKDILNHSDISPIFCPKFKYNIAIDSDGEMFNNYIVPYCFCTFGKQYDNWHVYYHRYSRNLSFKTEDYLVLYKMVFG